MWATLLRFQVRRLAFGAGSWGILSLVLLWATSSLYQRAYPDEEGRALLALSLGSNKALVAMLGTPRRLETVSGFVTWRSSLGLVIVIGIWGLLAGTRILRGDEESGRWEFLVSQPISSQGATAVAVAALWTSSLFIFFGLLAGMLLAVPGGEFRTPDSVAFAASHTLIGVVFASVGALTSQMFLQRRTANLAAGGLFVASLLARAVSAGSEGMSWFSWTTPVGWLDEVRPYAGVRPGPLLLLVASAGAISAAAVWLARQRDVGDALIRRSEHGPTRGILLGNVVGASVRFTLGGFLGWLAAAIAINFTFGAMAPSLMKALVESEAFQRFRFFIPFDLVTVKAYLGFTLQLTVGIVVCLMAATHVVGARNEESTGRLDVLLSSPISRREWIWPRLLVGICQLGVVGVAGTMAAWLGQAAFGGDVGAAAAAGASAAFLPLALLYLGAGVAAMGVAPRATAGFAWSSVIVSFFTYWIGALLEAPRWILGLSPFYHLAPAPLRPVNLVSAAVMGVLGAALTVLGVELFARRDLASE